MLLTEKYKDYSDFTAHDALDITLEAACTRNQKWESENDLGRTTARISSEVIEDIAEMYLNKILDLIMASAAETRFDASVSIVANEHGLATGEHRRAVNSLSLSIGNSLSAHGQTYRLSPEDVGRVFLTVDKRVSDTLVEKGFLVSSTDISNDKLKYARSHFISWNVDQDAVSHIYEIIDPSQLDAIKHGVPASDVFA